MPHIYKLDKLTCARCVGIHYTRQTNTLLWPTKNTLIGFNAIYQYMVYMRYNYQHFKCKIAVSAQRRRSYVATTPWMVWIGLFCLCSTKRVFKTNTWLFLGFRAHPVLFLDALAYALYKKSFLVYKCPQSARPLVGSPRAALLLGWVCVSEIFIVQGECWCAYVFNYLAPFRGRTIARCARLVRRSRMRILPLCVGDCAHWLSARNPTPIEWSWNKLGSDSISHVIIIQTASVCLRFAFIHTHHTLYALHSAYIPRNETRNVSHRAASGRHTACVPYVRSRVFSPMCNADEHQVAGYMSIEAASVWKRICVCGVVKCVFDGAFDCVGFHTLWARVGSSLDFKLFSKWQSEFIYSSGISIDEMSIRKLLQLFYELKKNQIFFTFAITLTSPSNAS